MVKLLKKCRVRQRVGHPVQLLLQNHHYGVTTTTPHKPLIHRIPTRLQTATIKHQVTRHNTKFQRTPCIIHNLQTPNTYGRGILYLVRVY